jgi:hypothetical protein
VAAVDADSVRGDELQAAKTIAANHALRASRIILPGVPEHRRDRWVRDEDAVDFASHVTRAHDGQTAPKRGRANGLLGFHRASGSRVSGLHERRPPKEV